MKRIFLLLTVAGTMACTAEKKSESLKFIYMTDLHVENDFMERGEPRYTVWKPGNHEAIAKTYQFINEDPFCKDAEFLLMGGDQLNTGYTREQEQLDAEMINYKRLLGGLDLYSKALGTDLSGFKFAAPESYLCTKNLPQGQDPIVFHSPALDSRVIAIQGNHDTGVPEFYHECAFQCKGTRFICFFASYVGLPAPPGHYRSTGKISDETMDFIESQMKAAAEDKEVRNIVLVCHWAIAEEFTCPIKDACPENGMNDNRSKLLALAEQYGCRLFINGHEHRQDYPVAKVGNMYDINCGSCVEGTWSVVELTDKEALFHIYSMAKVEENADGQTMCTAMPERISTVRIEF